MKLSAPIHVLKSQAKSLKTSRSLPMHEALDLVAKREGFGSWSLLCSKSDEIFPRQYSEILDFLNPGDLVLLGSRPGGGKTQFALGLLAQAIQQGDARNCLFTLDLVEHDVADRLRAYGLDLHQVRKQHLLDFSDEIDANHIIESSRPVVSRGSLVVIDYLQLLDQRRSSPSLQEQTERLSEFAKEVGCVILFISQVGRGVESRPGKRPSPADVRLPNPVDMGFFNKMMFILRSEKLPRETEVIFFKPKEFTLKAGWDSTESNPVYFDL